MSSQNQPGAMIYTQGFGSRPENVEVPHYDSRAPTTTDILYPVGKRWIYTNTGEWVLLGFSSSGGVTTANWEQIVSSTGDVLSVTGTANQILATPTTGNVVLSLIGPYTPATYTAHGVLVGEGTSSIAATAAGTTGQVLTGTTGADPAFANIGTNSGLTLHGVVIAENTGAFAATSAGTAGQVLTSGGGAADPTWTTATYPSTVTAGGLIAATGADVIGAIADVAVGQVLASGGVGVIPAYTDSPSVTGSITAGTGITSTTGDIKATAGQLIAGGDSAGVVSTISLTNTSDATIGAGAGSIAMATANPGTNAAWIKIYVGVTAYWIPVWTTNAP